MIRPALIWEHWGGKWHRDGGPMSADGARATAAYIRDPVSDDDDAHEAKVFTLEMSGVVADLTAEAFARLRRPMWVMIRGRRVNVTRRLEVGAVEVYDDELVAYYTVVAPCAAGL